MGASERIMRDIQDKREGARQARRLAWLVPDPADRARMMAFAEDLEREADELEQQAAATPVTGT
jgi:hypothetical protein